MRDRMRNEDSLRKRHRRHPTMHVRRHLKKNAGVIGRGGEEEEEEEEVAL